MIVPLLIVSLILAAAAMSMALSAVMRAFALRRRMVDRPDHRTMHQGAIPRGGGVAIVTVVLAGMGALALLSLINGRTFLGIALAAAAVALVSWLDDRAGVSNWVRAAVHLGAAAWVVLVVGPPSTLRMGGWELEPGLFTILGWVLAIAWLVNLYNFMDGIDGLAGGEAVSVAGIAGAVLAVEGHGGLATMAFLVMAASAGFLRWNWPPARLFMGDVGSATLGFLFGALALVTARAGALSLSFWLLLLAPFWFDATVTLVRRIAMGDQWYAPHRQHAYQRAVQTGLSQRAVTGTFITLNLLLGMLGWLLHRNPEWIPAGWALALTLLVSLYLMVERRLPMDATRPRE